MEVFKWNPINTYRDEGKSYELDVVSMKNKEQLAIISVGGIQFSMDTWSRESHDERKSVENFVVYHIHSNCHKVFVAYYCF